MIDGTCETEEFVKFDDCIDDMWEERFETSTLPTFAKKFGGIDDGITAVALEVWFVLFDCWYAKAAGCTPEILKTIRSKKKKQSIRFNSRHII